jgi:hypothetical protein
MSMDHEFDRIKQFENESLGDEEKFRQKVLLRAARSSNKKKQAFVDALRVKGYATLATFIDGIMVDHS